MLSLLPLSLRERGLPLGMPINEPGGGIEIRHKGSAYSTNYRWITVK
jgi:hypothetical protein